ncbi:MAG: ferrochelatase [Pseudomonadota bacterium]
MPRFSGQRQFDHSSPDRLGILLSNLGTPDAPTPKALRRYLGEFLSDPRVIELPRPIWWLVLNLIILRTRPSKSAEAYASVWTDEGSPLLAICKRQRNALQELMDQRFENPPLVALGMRYGNPSIESAVKELISAGARRLLVLPLYPQYGSAITASTFDEVTRVLQGYRWVPQLRFVNSYHDDEAYIGAVAQSLREHWQTNGRGDILVFSFHGIPRQSMLAGDPYYCHCLKTARLVAERLHLAEDSWKVTFQSRLGPAEWLQPYTAATMEELGKARTRRVDVICPGFSADCVETLEEIQLENRDIFQEAGGGEFSYVPALNDREDHIEALYDLVVRHASGWPEVSRGEGPLTAEDTVKRALAMGAAR